MNVSLNPNLDLSEAFREAFRRHPAGAAILTAEVDGNPVALTVSSLISVSTQPPTVAFSLSAQSASSRTLGRAKTLVIHFLRLEDMALAQLCANSGADRFGPGVNWVRLATGEPNYTDIGVWFRAKVVNELAVAGATLIVAELLDGQVETANAAPEDTSMVYLNRHWHGVRQMVA